jgi:hypothetical protein
MASADSLEFITSTLQNLKKQMDSLTEQELVQYSASAFAAMEGVNKELRQENKELKQENRELRQENKELRKEVADSQKRKRRAPPPPIPVPREELEEKGPVVATSAPVDRPAPVIPPSLKEWLRDQCLQASTGSGVHVKEAIDKYMASVPSVSRRPAVRECIQAMHEVTGKRPGKDGVLQDMAFQSQMSMEAPEDEISLPMPHPAGNSSL